MRTVFAGPAHVLVGYCTERGVQLAPALARLRADAAPLRLPEERLTRGASDALWRLAFDATRDPALGLHVAEAVPVGTFRIIHFLCANSPTVGDAFERVVAFARWADDTDCLRVREQAGHIGIELAATSHHGCAERQAAEFALASCYLGVKRSTQVDFRPLAVELAYPRSDEQNGRRIFGCPVSYERSRSCLWLRRDDWTRPVPRANAALLEILESHAKLLIATLPVDPPLVAAVRHALMQHIPERVPPIEDVARGLGVSARGLQRSLTEAGTSYSQLRDSARLSLARGMLEDRRLSLTQIALQLGYSEQSAFTRAYKRWTGLAPARTRLSSRVALQPLRRE